MRIRHEFKPLIPLCERQLLSFIRRAGPSRRKNRSARPGLGLACLRVRATIELVASSMNDGCEKNSHNRKSRHPARQGVSDNEQFAGSRMWDGEKSLFGENHRRVFQRLYSRQALETAIPNRPNSQNPSGHEDTDASTAHQSSQERLHRQNGRSVIFKHDAG